MSVTETSVKCYDVVRLVDGRTADVIEVYTKPDARVGFEVEFHDTDHETDVVAACDIAEVLFSLTPAAVPKGSAGRRKLAQRVVSRARKAKSPVM